VPEYFSGARLVFGQFLTEINKIIEQSLYKVTIEYSFAITYDYPTE